MITVTFFGGPLDGQTATLHATPADNITVESLERDEGKMLWVVFLYRRTSPHSYHLGDVQIAAYAPEELGPSAHT